MRVCVRSRVRVFTSGSMSAGRVRRSSVGQKHISVVVLTRGNSSAGHSQCCGRAAQLESTRRVCFCSLSACSARALHSHLVASFRFCRPSPSCLDPASTFQSNAWLWVCLCLKTYSLVVSFVILVPPWVKFTYVFPESQYSCRT